MVSLTLFLAALRTYTCDRVTSPLAMPFFGKYLQRQKASLVKKRAQTCLFSERVVTNILEHQHYCIPARRRPLARPSACVDCKRKDFVISRSKGARMQSASRCYAAPLISRATKGNWRVNSALLRALQGRVGPRRQACPRGLAGKADGRRSSQMKRKLDTARITEGQLFTGN